MKEAKIHNTMGSGIMWGRGVVGIVGIVVLILVVAALVKYVFPDEVGHACAARRIGYLRPDLPLSQATIGTTFR